MLVSLHRRFDLLAQPPQPARGWQSSRPSAGSSLPEPRGFALLRPRGLFSGPASLRLPGRVGWRGSRSLVPRAVFLHRPRARDVDLRGAGPDLPRRPSPAVLSWRAAHLDALAAVVESTRGELAHRRPVAAHEAARSHHP